MNLRSVVLFLSFAVLAPINVQAVSFSELIYNLDRFLEYITFGLIDIKDEDELEDIDSDLPGGVILGGTCDSLKNIALNVAIEQSGGEIPPEIEVLVENVKCGCDLFRLGGEMKFGCNFEEPVCQNISTSDLPIRRRLVDTTAPTPAPILPEAIGICATASVRADFNRHSTFTPIEEASLTTSACAEIINATFYPQDVSAFPEGVTIPKLCARVDFNDGLKNLTSLESCGIYVVRPDDTVEECSKCEICGPDGLGVSFDCSNVNLDNSGKYNFTLPSFGDVCLSSGSIPLKALNDPTFVYRPFLTPMP